MNSAATFQLHSEFSLLTPASAALQRLTHAIQRGHTIRSRQSGVQSLPLDADNMQWVLCETSGSSGQPKTIRRKPATWIQSFSITEQTLCSGQRATYATFGRLQHSLVLYASTEAMSLGASLLDLSGQSPRQQALGLRDYRATVLYATPAQLRLLVAGGELAGIARLPDIRHVFCGGGKLLPELRSVLADLMPLANIVEFYGSSETSFISLASKDAPPKSVGRPYPGVQVGIGEDMSQTPFESGEVWIKSPYLFDGYAFGHSAETRWHEGALTIGELGFLDPAGHLFLEGRKSRMITVADNNVSLDAIEAALSQLPGVEICAAFAKPDSSRGHVPICVVQCAGEGLNKEIVVKHCKAHIGPHATPRAVHFVPKIPLMSSGKPDLGELKRVFGVGE